MRQSPLLPNGSITDEVRHALALVRRGCDELLVEDEFAQKLAHSAETGAPLRIKLGLDPTAPDIHLGHTVALNKMRQLQALGHRVIFLSGDFPAWTGVPLGPTGMRRRCHASRSARMRRRILHRPRGFWTLEKPRFATTVNGGQRLAQKDRKSVV